MVYFFFCLLLFTELNEMHLVCIITLNMRPEKVDVLFHFCLLSFFYQYTVDWGQMGQIVSPFVCNSGIGQFLFLSYK